MPSSKQSARTQLKTTNLLSKKEEKRTLAHKLSHRFRKDHIFKKALGEDVLDFLHKFEEARTD